MKFLSIAVLLLAASSLPLSASAQQAQQVPQAGYPQQGYPQQGYPQQGYPQQGYPQQGGKRQNPQRMYQHWMRLLSNLNLSSQQQGQIQNAIGQYVQAHPAGSAPDPQGRRALLQQVFSALTPQQQDQLRQTMQQEKEQRLQRQLQRVQQGGQGQGQPPQGQPPR